MKIFRNAANTLEIIDVTATAAELNYLDLAAIGTGAASKAVVLNSASDYTFPAAASIVMPSGGDFTFSSGSTLDVAGTFEIANAAMTSTAVELNKMDDSVTVLTKGAGVSAMESYAVGYLRNGTLVTTRILVDLTGLVSAATDLDIIGNTGGAASAHIGQYTTALLGTLAGGRVMCLELPAGGAVDIDFYSATVSTGAQDGLVTDLTETALVTSGGNWANGTQKGFTLMPAANDYLYICSGAATGGTYTAGKFLIELYGYVA